MKAIALPLVLALAAGCPRGGGSPSADGGAFLAIGQGTCLDIRDYGGVGDDATDTQPALASAYAALPSVGGCVAFPAGKFRFDSSVALDFPAQGYSVTVIGAGSNATVLHFPKATAGLVFNHTNPAQATHVRDLALTTGLAGGARGIVLAMSPSQSGMGPGLPTPNDVSDVTLFGDDFDGTGGGAHYWGTGIDVLGVSFIDFNGVEILGGSGPMPGNGDGIVVAGIPPPTGGGLGQAVFGLYYNVAASYFINLAVGFLYGTYVQGVTINTSNFQNGGIAIKDEGGEQALGNLTVESSQFNTYGAALIQSSSGMQVQIMNSIFFVMPGQIGVDLEQGSLGSIVGNSFWPGSSTGGIAILVGPGGEGAIITGNAFLSSSVAVKLLAGSSSASVQANSYVSVVTHVVDEGANDRIGGGSD